MTDDDERREEILAALDRQLEFARSGVAEMFRLLWAREDARALAMSFAGGEAHFIVGRYGVRIVLEPPPTGEGVPDTLEGWDGDVS